MNSVEITMLVVGVFVVLVVARIVWESRVNNATANDFRTLCPTCGHEYSGDDADSEGLSNAIRRMLRLAPLPEYRCTELSKEWEATAQGSMDCDCTNDFHKPRYSLAA